MTKEPYPILELKGQIHSLKQKVDYWKQLLQKYVIHVNEEEGITFIGSIRVEGTTWKHAYPIFTEQEASDLKNMDDVENFNV